MTSHHSGDQRETQAISDIANPLVASVAVKQDHADLVSGPSQSGVVRKSVTPGFSECLTYSNANTANPQNA